MEAYCRAALYFIIQITLPTMRIIFPQCAFNFHISLFFIPSLVPLTSTPNYSHSWFSETRQNSDVTSLNEKHQSSKVDKLILKNHSSGDCACTQCAFLFGSCSIIRPERPRRRGLGMLSQSLNARLITRLAPKPIFGNKRAGSAL